MLVLTKAMELGVEVRAIALSVRRHDRSLADQMQRAMQAIVLHRSGIERSGVDAVHGAVRFREATAFGFAEG